MEAYKTPIEDLRKSALDHYDQASSAIHHWSSSVPQAINFYFDEQEKRKIFSIKIFGFEFSLKK